MTDLSQVTADLTNASAMYEKMFLEMGNDKAEPYYQEKVFPEIRKYFRLTQPKVNINPSEYVGLVTVVGMSPEPLILMMDLIPAQYHLLLYTEGSKDSLDRIFKDCPDVKSSTYFTAQVDETNPIAMYHEILAFHKKVNGANPTGKIAMNITGGNKPMAGIAAMTAGRLGLDVVYINSQRSNIKGLPHPVPGTEELIMIPNPLEILGVLEHEEALRLFNSFDYGNAADIWEKLHPRVRTKGKMYYLHMLLAKTYMNWEILRAQDALNNITELNDELKAYRLEGRPLFHNALEGTLLKQQTALEHLSRMTQIDSTGQRLVLVDKNVAAAFIFTLINRARRRFRLKRYDDTLLLSLRLLEFFAQRRLAAHGINPDNLIKELPEYVETKFGMTAERFFANVNETRALVMGRTTPLDFFGKRYPGPIDLYAILHNLNDPMLNALIKTHGNLKMLFSKINECRVMRNDSWISHGFNFTDKKDAETNLIFVERVLEHYVEAEGLDGDWWDEATYFIDLRSGDSSADDPAA